MYYVTFDLFKSLFLLLVLRSLSNERMGEREREREAENAAHEKAEAARAQQWNKHQQTQVSDVEERSTLCQFMFVVTKIYDIW